MRARECCRPLLGVSLSHSLLSNFGQPCSNRCARWPDLQFLEEFAIPTRKMTCKKRGWGMCCAIRRYSCRVSGCFSDTLQARVTLSLVAIRM